MENSNKSKFCAECGAALETAADSLYCTQCGTENKKSNNFCAKCGTNLQKRKSTHKKKSSAKNYQKRSRRKVRQKRLAIIDLLQGNKTFAIVGLVVAAFLLILFLSDNKTNINTRAYIPNNNSVNYAGLKGSRINDIASKFLCTCGSSSCNDLSLEVCDCPTSKEEKAFIQSQINNGKSDSQTIIAVNSKYGRIIPQFKNLLSAMTKTSKSSSNLMANNVKIATLFDMDLITEQFRCPCGQCNIEELKDCSCNHPRGATEVKGFITDKINKNIYSVEQIVSFVNKKYGGKKI